MKSVKMNITIDKMNVRPKDMNDLKFVVGEFKKQVDTSKIIDTLQLEGFEVNDNILSIELEFYDYFFYTGHFMLTIWHVDGIEFTVIKSKYFGSYNETDNSIIFNKENAEDTVFSR